MALVLHPHSAAIIFILDLPPRPEPPLPLTYACRLLNASAADAQEILNIILITPEPVDGQSGRRGGLPWYVIVIIIVAAIIFCLAMNGKRGRR